MKPLIRKLMLMLLHASSMDYYLHCMSTFMNVDWCIISLQYSYVKLHKMLNRVPVARFLTWFQFSISRSTDSSITTLSITRNLISISQECAVFYGDRVRVWYENSLYNFILETDVINSYSTNSQTVSRQHIGWVNEVINWSTGRKNAYMPNVMAIFSMEMISRK